MAKLTINKSLLDKEVLTERHVKEEFLSHVVYNCREVRGLFLLVSVNETLIPKDDWHLFKLNTFDHITITARPEKGALPYVGAVIGAVVAVVSKNPALGWATFKAIASGAAVGYSLGSLANALLFPPTLPNVPVYTGDGASTINPNYGWDGARLVTQPGGPKTVLYGQHRISGALIMQYISSDGDKNYLNMLINIGQGDIEGIMKTDGSGVCVSNETTPETDTTDSVGVADVDGNFAIGTDNDTGTFSILPSYTRALTVNGVMKGANSYNFLDTKRLYSVIARPILFYKFGGIWRQKNGAYATLRHDQETVFSFSVDKSSDVSGVITDFYVRFDYNSEKTPYMLIEFGENQKTYEYLHLTTYTAVEYSFDAPDIEINDQKFIYFENSVWDYRTGTYDQSVIDGFHATRTFFNDGRKVESSEIVYTSTGTSLDAFEVQITCPLLYQQDSQGNIINNTVTYKIEYQVVGAGEWTDGGSFTLTGATKTTIYEYRKYENLEAEQYNIRITRISPVYTSFRKAGDLVLGGVTEIVSEDIAYRNSALISLKLQASDQLSGSTPNVTALVRGIKILVPKLTISEVVQIYDDCYWDDDAGAYKLIDGDTTCVDTGEYVRQWSRNPIWCTRDFILNKRYGLGDYIDVSLFNEAAAAIEAKYCWEMVTDFDGGTEHRFEMDLPISSVMTPNEALKLLQRCFRGWIIWSNGTYKPVIDRPKDETQVFNGSSIKGRVKTVYFKASQIPNKVEIQFANPARSFNVEPLEIVDEDEWTSKKPLLSHTINAIGTIRESEIIRYGRYYLNSQKHSTKALEYISPGDAVDCEPGDTIRLQDDLLAWGVGGRVVAANADSITTNIDITYTADYEVRVRLPDFSLETRTVSSVTNNGRTINVSSSFSSTPIVDSVFTYGAENVDSKPFKVKSITRLENNDNEREMFRLLVAEENDNKYNDTLGVSLPDPTYTRLPNPTDITDNVTDLNITEMTSRPGFYVSFNIPQENFNFHHAALFLSTDNNSWWIYRTDITSRSNIEVLGMTPGQTYYIKVVSYNDLGAANPSPVTSFITLRLSPFTPPNVTGLQFDRITKLLPSQRTIFYQRDAKFRWNQSSTVSGAGNILAGQEPLGAGEFVQEINYKYLVELWVTGIKVRTKIVSDPAYIYTYEKNRRDNDPASNEFTIKIWGFNQDGNIRSSSAATLAVINPAPSAVSGLVAVPFMAAIKFSWNPSPESDFDYYKIRTRVEDDAWAAWENYSGTQYFRGLTDAEINDHTKEATIYIEITAVDTFLSESAAISTNAAALGLNVESTDINDFAVEASKIFTKIPILESDSWTDDTPDTNSVTWNQHNLFYNGAQYIIAAGNTDKKYIYWENGNTSYTTSDTNPTLSDGDFIIATNVDGAHDLAWNAIANQVIGSAYIQLLAVQNAHINDLNAAKITAGFIDVDRIEALSILAEKIQVGTLTADRIISTAGLNSQRLSHTGQGSAVVPRESSYLISHNLDRYAVVSFQPISIIEQYLGQFTPTSFRIYNTNDTGSATISYAYI